MEPLPFVSVNPFVFLPHILFLKTSSIINSATFGLSPQASRAWLPNLLPAKRCDISAEPVATILLSAFIRSVGHSCRRWQQVEF